MVIPGNIGMLIVTETKLDASFEIAQFCIVGLNEPYRLDRNRNGGWILIYVRQYIPTRLLKLHTFSYDIEGIFLEMNLRKTKWIHGPYHLPGQDDKYFFGHLGKALDIYSDKYDKFLLAVDFNAEEGESCLDTFLCDYGPKNIVKDRTCFKNVENPSCIDLFITNSNPLYIVFIKVISKWEEPRTGTIFSNFSFCNSVING